MVEGNTEKCNVLLASECLLLLYAVRCICGADVTEGQGNSKRSSKKKAAELMLEKLQSDAATNLSSKPKTKSITNKRKNRNLIKVCPCLIRVELYTFLHVLGFTL